MMAAFNYLPIPLLLFLSFTLTSCAEGNNSQRSNVTNNKSPENTMSISWNDLIPEGYRPESIFARYQSELERFAKMDDPASNPEAIALFKKIDAEMKKMPTNEALNNKSIKLAGFIAPLNNNNGLITEFLFVPYLGACIHVPPPPTNQIVMVNVKSENGIKPENAFGAFWVSGRIRILNTKTDIGESGYIIDDATVKIYKE